MEIASKQKIEAYLVKNYCFFSLKYIKFKLNYWNSFNLISDVDCDR